jgi:hypothetical protein
VGISDSDFFENCTQLIFDFSEFITHLEIWCGALIKNVLNNEFPNLKSLALCLNEDDDFWDEKLKIEHDGEKIKASTLPFLEHVLLLPVQSEIRSVTLIMNLVIRKTPSIFQLLLDCAPNLKRLELEEHRMFPDLSNNKKIRYFSINLDRWEVLDPEAFDLSNFLTFSQVGSSLEEVILPDFGNYQNYEDEQRTGCKFPVKLENLVKFQVDGIFTILNGDEFAKCTLRSSPKLTTLKFGSKREIPNDWRAAKYRNWTDGVLSSKYFKSQTLEYLSIFGITNFDTLTKVKGAFPSLKMLEIGYHTGIDPLLKIWNNLVMDMKDLAIFVVHICNHSSYTLHDLFQELLDNLDSFRDGSK